MGMKRALEVAKVNKRLIIRDAATATLVYCAPSFLRPVADRGVMRDLADQLQSGAGIQAIIAFETAHSPKRKKSRATPKDDAARV